MMKSDRLLRVLYGVLIGLAAISLITSFPKVGMTSLALCIVSFFLGFATKAGYLRVRGERVKIPIIERSRVSFSLLVVVMLSLSLATIFQVQGVVDRTEDCNRQFRNALTYNASLNLEANKLNDDLERELSRRRVAFDELIDNLGPGQIATPGAVRQYRTIADDVERRVNEIGVQKMTAQKSRAPYPDPTCGRDG